MCKCSRTVLCGATPGWRDVTGRQSSPGRWRKEDVDAVLMCPTFICLFGYWMGGFSPPRPYLQASQPFGGLDTPFILIGRNYSVASVLFIIHPAHHLHISLPLGVFSVYRGRRRASKVAFNN